MKNTRLVALRANLTQKELASEIGMPISTYAMIETGRRFPRKKQQVRICNHFGVTVDYLFFGSDKSDLGGINKA